MYNNIVHMGAHGHWLAWVNRWDQNGAYTLHISCDFNHSTIVLTLRYPYISNLTISNPDGSLTSSNTNISSTHALQPSCLPLKLEKWKKKNSFTLRLVFESNRMKFKLMCGALRMAGSVGVEFDLFLFFIFSGTHCHRI